MTITVFGVTTAAAVLVAVAAAYFGAVRVISCVRKGRDKWEVKLEK